MLRIEELKKEHLYHNALLNIQEMLERKTELRSYPFKVFVEPTQRCDIACIMCSKARRMRRIDMPLGLFRAIERELFPHVSEVGFFMYGEPLVAQHIHEMLCSARRYHFLPKIFTNAAYTKEDTIRLLVELGFFVNISIDGATKDTYERIRRGARWENTLKNIERYLYYQDKIRNPRFHIRLACTVSPLNIGEAVNLMKLAHGYGIRDVFFNNCDQPAIFRKFQLSLVADKAREAFRLAKAFADRHKIRFSCQKKVGGIDIEDAHNWNDFTLPIDDYSPDYLEKYSPYNGKCFYPWSQVAIRADGVALPCCQGHINMGYFRGDNFRQIWNGRKYRTLRGRKSYYRCGASLVRWRCQLARTSVWGNAA